VEVKPGHTSLRVSVRQGEACDESAYVRHWRVTYCTQATSEEDARKHYFDDLVSILRNSVSAAKIFST
jgi:hypothetical protein